MNLGTADEKGCNEDMKPLVLIFTHYSTGGSRVYLEELAGALEKTGYPVSFCLPKNSEIRIKNRALCRYVLKDPSTNPSFNTFTSTAIFASSKIGGGC